MTNTRMKNEQPECPRLRDDLVAALADGAAGVLQHVKWPMLIEMELAQSALAEGERDHQQVDSHPRN